MRRGGLLRKLFSIAKCVIPGGDLEELVTNILQERACLCEFCINDYQMWYKRFTLYGGVYGIFSNNTHTTKSNSCRLDDLNYVYF